MIEITEDRVRDMLATRHISELLRFIGEDPERDGLKDTPKRVIKALKEMTSGYDADISQILSRTFQQEDEEAVKYHGMVVLRGIEYASLCEHHMLSFFGQTHVIYIPGESGLIVGISKLARLVDAFSKRLQVQERMTAQIADAIETHLQPKGVMVVVEGTHLCMRFRGVGKQNSVMVTSEVRGAFTELKTKEEGLALIRMRVE